MNHTMIDGQRSGAPLPLASDPADPSGCCGGNGECAPGAAAAAVPLGQPTAQTADRPEPPTACCDGLVCVPITDAATGRVLGPDDWGWWEKHLGYQPPRPGQVEVYEENRRQVLRLADHLYRTLPPGEDRNFVLRELGIVLMLANNAVAAHGVAVAVGVPDAG